MSDYEFFLSRRLSAAQATELTEACGYLRQMEKLHIDFAEQWGQPGRQTYRRDRRSLKTELDQLVQTLAQKRLYGLRISTRQQLMVRYQAWQTAGRESLLSGCRGNQNRCKTPAQNRELAQNRLLTLYASPLKPTFTQVADCYNAEAKTHGWGTLTTERVRQILSAPALRHQWLEAREGRETARQLLEHSFRRNRPHRPDILWSMDGASIQLLGRDRAGNIVWSSGYMVLVVDAFRDTVIGYAFGKTETSDLVCTALKMAVQRAGTLPEFLQHDHAGANTAHETRQLLQKLDIRNITARPYNAKAKYVERVIGFLEQQIFRLFPNFKGGNLSARSRHTRANPDFLKSLIRDTALPTEAQQLFQARLAIETYNQTIAQKDSQTRLQHYCNPHPERRQISRLTAAELFCVLIPKPATYSPKGLSFQFQKQTYTYEVESQPGLESLEFRNQYLGDQFLVRFNPLHPNTAYLYDLQDRYLATATQKYAFAPIPSLRPEGETEIWQKGIRQKDQFFKENTQKLTEAQRNVTAAGLAPISFEGIHKDAYNRAQDYLQRDELGIGDWVSGTGERGIGESGLGNREPETTAQSQIPNPKSQNSLYINYDAAAKLLLTAEDDY